MKKWAIWMIAAALVAVPAHAAVQIEEFKTTDDAGGAKESFASKAQAKQVFDAAMQKVAAGDMDGAFALVEPYIPMEAKELESMKAQFMKQREIVHARYGNPLDIEFYGEQSLKEIFVRYTYIEKFERHALRWLITIYKPADAWVIDAFLFDDAVAALLD